MKEINNNIYVRLPVVNRLHGWLSALFELNYICEISLLLLRLNVQYDLQITMIY